MSWLFCSFLRKFFFTFYLFSFVTEFHITYWSLTYSLSLSFFFVYDVEKRILFEYLIINIAENNLSYHRYQYMLRYSCKDSLMSLIDESISVYCAKMMFCCSFRLYLDTDKTFSKYHINADPTFGAIQMYAYIRCASSVFLQNQLNQTKYDFCYCYKRYSNIFNALSKLIKIMR